jgi:hypothetical protein
MHVPLRVAERGHHRSPRRYSLAAVGSDLVERVPARQGAVSRGRLSGEVSSSADVRHLDLGLGRRLRRSQFGVPVGSSGPYLAREGGEIGVGRAFA